MKNLWPYLAKHKISCLLAPLFKMLEAAFELCVPILLARMIDLGIEQGDSSQIGYCALALLGLALVGYACSVTAQFFAARAAVDFSASLREALFCHIQALSFQDLDRIGTETLLNRLNSDIMLAQTGVNMFLRLFLRSPFVVFGAFLCAVMIDAHAAGVFALVILVLFLLVGAVMAVSLPRLKRVQESLDHALLLIRENLTGVRVLRAFGREEKEKENFGRANDDLFHLQVSSGNLSGIMNPGTGILINGGIILLLWVCGGRVESGILSQGQTIALYNYMGQILIELVKLANFVVTLSRGITGASRVSQVLAMKPSIPKDEVETQTAVLDLDIAQGIEFSKVSLKFAGARNPALEDIDFRVMPGQTIGIIGPTGSGKSALMQLLPRFYEASAGKVCLFGKEVKDYPVPVLRSLVGFVSQRSVIFAGTIRDNLLMGNPEASEGELLEALRIAQALEVVEGKGGLDAVLEAGGRNLSGGQRQRLSIARGLLTKSRILVLDDSFSALDYATDKKLREALRESAASDPNRITFIVSQRAASILEADKILVMEKGKIAAQGTHAQLLAESELYQEIYHTQFGTIQNPAEF